MNAGRKRTSRTLRRVVTLAVTATLSAILPGCRKESPREGWTKLLPELQVEIAKTPEQRERGLMFRQHLPKNQGMYFIFDEEQQLYFYMRDTRIPLSIAFIRRNGIIEVVKDLVPLVEVSVPSDVPAQFALEVNRGWFDENGIRPGDKVVLKGDSVHFFRKIYR